MMSSQAPQHCPQCKTVSSPSAERCDCGHTFGAASSTRVAQFSSSERESQNLSPIGWYLEAFRRYATFSGRASRTQYFSFVLVNVGTSLVASVIDPRLALAYGLAAFIPGGAVTVRRIQDTGRSGRWLYALLIPFLGALLIFSFLLSASEKRDNRYGRYPAT